MNKKEENPNIFQNCNFSLIENIAKKTKVLKVINKNTKKWWELPLSQEEYDLLREVLL